MRHLTADTLKLSAMEPAPKVLEAVSKRLSSRTTLVPASWTLADGITESRRPTAGRPTTCQPSEYIAQCSKLQVATTGIPQPVCFVSGEVSAMGVQTKEHILSLIEAHQNQIRQLGIRKLGLFGSFVRQQQNSDSDIDILVEFESGQKTFDNFMQTALLLEALFGRRVELVTPEALSPYIGPRNIEACVCSQPGDCWRSIEADTGRLQAKVLSPGMAGNGWYA
ncbi:nucleotidyltransferase family protein [Chloracidobacterium thermophilum]|uniref:nucleotidyltransferase family protein n=1 Tax=Chloracidobacterium thermophilum TaxID=458033 RepID=UPI00321FEB36